MKLQNNVSFTGQVLVMTYPKSGEKPIKQTFKTSKLQDGQILAETAKTLRQLGFREKVYGKDTLNLHKLLEKTLNTTIAQPGTGNGKCLEIGGYTKDSYYGKPEYDTSYNKIFYNDKSYSYPNSRVIIDLMEPEERKAACDKILVRIKNTLKGMTGVEDTTLDNVKYKGKSGMDFTEIEVKLMNTLKDLDGYLEGPDPIITARKYSPAKAVLLDSAKTPEKAYNILLQKLGKLLGNEEIKNIKIHNTISEDSFRAMKRVIATL